MNNYAYFHFSASLEVEQARSVDGEQGAFVDIDDIQRFSQLRTKSASDLDLTKDYQTLGASATPPVRSEGRKSSYAGIIPNTFMSESCDNVSDLGVSIKNFVKFLVLSVSVGVRRAAHTYNLVYP